MSKGTACGLLVICCLIICVSAVDDEDVLCNCDDEGFWSIQSIMECQKVSDFLIAVAYFSIPVELLYFISFSNVPFKWVLVQFILFIVLCGLTHLLNGWTYYGPHSFQLMLSLTIAKLLTALVSCATAITLLTLIPLLLKWKVRELFLKQNVLELGQEVGMMKRQKEASWHVRMLTREIRKSLDKHTILYTTLVELSKTLALHNCAVWMPNETRTKIVLTHELQASSKNVFQRSLPINDPDVQMVKKSNGVKILSPQSVLGAASSDESGEEPGAVAAIRMPMLRFSDFKGGTPERLETCYAILVLVLPNTNSRAWSDPELEIVEVVADQVAVALSHAAVLEESQIMREKLSEQNRALQQARKNAMMASQARNSFEKVMSHGMRRPMHSILGLLSMFQEENLNAEQKIIVDTMLKTGTVLSTLINDVMDLSTKDGGGFPVEIKPFRLHSLIREATCLAKCLCVYKGFDFSVDVQSSLPDHVMGDERRVFQVILHMVGYLLNVYNGKGCVNFRVFMESNGGDQTDKMWGAMKPGLLDESASIKFQIEISGTCSPSDETFPNVQFAGKRHNSNEIKEGLSFTVCKRLVQMMQGNIWMTPNSQGLVQSMTLVIRFQKQSPSRISMFQFPNPSEQRNLSIQFQGLKVLLADDDDVNRTVTKKLLEKLGCQVTAVSSGFECLSALGHAEHSYRVVILDLHMPEMDGFEVATRIRKFRSRSGPMIVALTASAEENVWERCLQIGMNGLMRKPVLLQGMADELKRVLQWAGDGFR